MKATLLAACAVALCASAVATSRGLRWGNWWQEQPVWNCAVDNYVCVDGDHFCLGGIAMRCAAGTWCETQPAWARADTSPCVSASSGSREACSEGWRWHEEDQCCVQEAEPCNEGFWWSADEGCCRKAVVDVEVEHKPEPEHEAEHTCESGWRWHEEDECCVQEAEPCDEGFHWSADEGCCRKAVVEVTVEKKEEEHTCAEGEKWHDEDECCVQVAQPCKEGFSWKEEEGCCRKVVVVVAEVNDECDGWGCEDQVPEGGWKYAECQGKERCHESTQHACGLPNYHCVDGRNFCLGRYVMRCAAGTVCSTRAYVGYGISPCVHPWQA